MFKFKKFSILQDKSAMKVGTDGVLLGAWVPVENNATILDIGTGTGLIALMLAQRSSDSLIDALEIDADAFNEAKINFEESNWFNKLSLIHTSLQLYQTEKKYSLIVSNPPYYTDTFKSNSSQRTLARHVGELTFKVLLTRAAFLLKEDGVCAFILPYKEEESFIKQANALGLYANKITRVRGRKAVEVKRSMLLLTKKITNCSYDELIIEVDRHVYTEEYISLTKEFYLKM